MHVAVEPAPQAPPAAAADSVIAVRGLGKRYEIYAQPRDRLLQSLFRGRRQFFQEFWALSDVSFDVARGESVGIIGRNGSGKSTLLQLIAGTLTATTGSVNVHGRVAALLELGSGFNPEFSGRENVYLNGAILGLSRSDIDARLDTIVAFAGLEEFIDRPVKTYSSGMLMRLAFSVAVNVEPDVLDRRRGAGGRRHGLPAQVRRAARATDARAVSRCSSSRTTRRSSSRTARGRSISSVAASRPKAGPR